MRRTDEFRRQAVDLYESTEVATLKGIAADLGVPWRRWPTLGRRARQRDHDRRDGSSSGASSARSNGGRTESSAAKLARLEARIRELEAETRELSNERNILRSAAKYFAGETTW